MLAILKKPESVSETIKTNEPSSKVRFSPSPSIIFLFVILILIGCTLLICLVWPQCIWALIFLLPIFMLAAHDIVQKKRTILRNYPVIGHIRYIFESIRPEIQQYFVESDRDGVPFSREYRSLIYQRAKKQRDTRPFGTIFDVYRGGHEWVNHSLGPLSSLKKKPRIQIGGPDCNKPYYASLLNISAMSYGALSKNAILALNKGARIGDFAHNTGEGGVSDYHLEHNGDLIWQIGTGYFGCRDVYGRFEPNTFARTASKKTIKMIEIKLSQGAKPGHGGILPAAKLTAEIAEIRGVKMGSDVISPRVHSAFSSPVELLFFLSYLRDLSGGKPVGFKLCIGHRTEFLAICKAILETGITPDFITVDGSEGGTGAAPVEFTNSVGTPLREGLLFVHNALIGIGVRKDIRIIASGKVVSAFHILRLLALGADAVNSARAMMMALGCIQARSCHNDRCPTGIATQNAHRYNALDVDSKAIRVANYQIANIESLVDLMASAGINKPNDVSPNQIYHRSQNGQIKSYAEIYDFLEAGALLTPESIPLNWARDWNRSNANSWQSM